jgi:hypothetical protein
MKLKPLALAMGVAAPIAGFAATITVDTAADQFSGEYLTAFKGAEAARATIALGAQYAQGDVLTIQYSAAPRATQTATTAFEWPSQLTIAVATIASDLGNTGTNSTVTAAGTNGALALFDSGDTSVSYRVTTAPSSSAIEGTANFGSVTVPDSVFFLASEIGASDVSISSSSATAQGLAFDAGAAKKVIDQTPGQFSYTVGGLSQTIDVESDRKKFLVGTTTATSIDISFTVNTNALGTNAESTATPGSVAVTLTGDFSWVDSSSTATGIQTSGISLSSGTLGGVSASSIGITLAASDTAETLALSNALGVIIPSFDISSSLVGYYNNGGTTGVGTNAQTNTGAFSLNGSTVTVYAVPTSSVVSNFIWLTNSGSTSGEVSIQIKDAGETIDLGVVGTSAAASEFDITAAMNAALSAQGKTLSGRRVHIDIITKVPSGDVAVSAAYKSGDDRVNLLTSLETDND